jgi:hypothetical protein
VPALRPLRAAATLHEPRLVSRVALPVGPGAAARGPALVDQRLRRAACPGWPRRSAACHESPSRRFTTPTVATPGCRGPEGPRKPCSSRSVPPSRQFLVRTASGRSLRRSSASAAGLRRRPPAPAVSRRSGFLPRASAQGSRPVRPRGLTVCGKRSLTVRKPCSAAITRPSCVPPTEVGATLSDRVFSVLPHARPEGPCAF